MYFLTQFFHCNSLDFGDTFYVGRENKISLTNENWESDTVFGVRGAPSTRGAQ